MVAKITFPRRLEDAVRYSEQKVQRGVAECIGAAGYLREARELGVAQKLEGLRQRSALNSRALTKTLHVSLNFHPSERLSDEALLQVTGRYMEALGFGDQPYLVYRHHDAGHPHVHVVSTLIRADGTRIPTHQIGRTLSEQARKAVEKAFGLLPAEGRGRLRNPQPGTGEAAKVVYGTQETQSSVARAVQWVLDTFGCTSLAQFNAALRTFNVLADRGRAGSRLFERGGLVYQVLDDRGKRVGVPIKASALAGRPTLKKLEAHFGKNSRLAAVHQEVRSKGAAALLPQVVPHTPSLSAEEGGAELLKKKKRKKKKGHHPC